MQQPQQRHQTGTSSNARDVEAAIGAAIQAHIPSARATVAASGNGHFTIEVVSSLFTGKNKLECHRLVYAAIAQLMDGFNAPIHAVDRLVIRADDGSVQPDHQATK